ncbi:MAG: choice-of-anchor tandem repeat GloVer-containing protein, partial [Candidatus Korobacteraceae bacterium]
SGPIGGLIFDAAGNLYGTTYAGGTGSGTDCTSFSNGVPGCGTVFELTPMGGGYWTETVLYSFCPQGGFCSDGEEPVGSLIFDAAGNLYGTTQFSGGVFELTPDGNGGWTETVLHVFGGDGDGYYPEAGVVFDAAGNLYGTTSYGGYYDYGTAFEVMPQAGGGWTETVVWSFGDGTDGAYPEAGLILDAAGNLYGTNLGTAFELIKPHSGGNWTEQVLHDFGGNNDGFAPYAGLVFDAAGNLYGTTYYGGTSGQHCNGGSERCGIAFELTPEAGGRWTETVLHDFGNGSDGADPYASLILDSAGNLYGTTQKGGAYGYGTVFELTPVLSHVSPCAVCRHDVLR